MTRIAISGFEPFGGLHNNPSEELVRLLAQERKELIAVILPTSYSKAATKLINAIEKASPSVCLMFGYAATPHALRLERYAKNVDVVQAPDNDGVVRQGSIAHDGPSQLQATLDVAYLHRVLQEEGHDVAISTNAGGYVCNHAYFEILMYLTSAAQECHALFVHIPGPSLADRTIRAAERLLLLLEGDISNVC
jgi:pyroglutamyl-peptidase